jgi:hypothetical protein
VRDVIHEPLFHEASLGKLAARAISAEMRPEGVQHFPGDRSVKTRRIDDDELERLLGSDHPVVLEARAIAKERGADARAG